MRARGRGRRRGGHLGVRSLATRRAPGRASTVLAAVRSGSGCSRRPRGAPVRRRRSRRRSSRWPPSCAAAGTVARRRADPRRRRTARSPPTCGACGPARTSASASPTRSRPLAGRARRRRCARRGRGARRSRRTMGGRRGRRDRRAGRTRCATGSGAAAEAGALSAQARLSGAGRRRGADRLSRLLDRASTRRRPRTLVTTTPGRVCLVLGLAFEAAGRVVDAPDRAGAPVSVAVRSAWRGLGPRRGPARVRDAGATACAPAASRCAGGRSSPRWFRAEPLGAVGAGSRAGARGRRLSPRAAGGGRAGRRWCAGPPCARSAHRRRGRAASSRSSSTCSAWRVGAGCTPYLAVEATVRWAPPGLGGALRTRARGSCRLGAAFPDALDELARDDTVARSPLVDALARVRPARRAGRPGAGAPRRRGAGDHAPARRGPRAPGAGSAALPARVPRAARVRPAHGRARVALGAHPRLSGAAASRPSPAGLPPALSAVVLSPEDLMHPPNLGRVHLHRLLGGPRAACRPRLCTASSVRPPPSTRS